ncbi:MAG TPA: CoA transferase, partial [Burkholderiales bacterium]|nr:CoA transferase [Burkholderiales bacterium]
RELDAVLALGRLSRDDVGGKVEFSGEDPLTDSVFPLGAIAAVGRMVPSVAAAALWKMRGGRGQDLRCDLRRAIHELAPDVRLNGFTPEQLASTWITRSGYNGASYLRTRDHRLVFLANPYPDLVQAMSDVIGLPWHRKDGIAAAIAGRDALELETAAAAKGACCVMVRTPQEWMAGEQARVLEGLPVVQIERLGDSAPEPLKPLGTAGPGGRPLSGVRALGLSRVLAGATIGTVLAEHGADVLNVWSPGSFETNNAYIYAHMGMRPTWIAEHTPEGKAAIQALLRGADILFENRREGVMARRGLSFEDCAELRPGIIHVSLRAFGHQGPWRDRVGFDTPVMCAMGGTALEGGSVETPRKPPKAPINDWIAGWFGAFGAMAALRLRATQGGSWRVRVSLARSCQWWMKWPRFDKPVTPRAAPLPIDYYRAQTGLGEYQGIPCQVIFSETQPYFESPLAAIGSARPEWISV